jgi:hypothetical protein
VVTTTPVTVTGMINDIVVGTVNVKEALVGYNGVHAQFANRIFVATPVPLTPGITPIICTGIDRAGNVDTEQISVNVNLTAPARLAIVSGNNQTARIGTLLSEPLVVALTEDGTPATGKPVQFHVLRNDGSLSTASGSRRAALECDGDAGTIRVDRRGCRQPPGGSDRPAVTTSVCSHGGGLR